MFIHSHKKYIERSMNLINPNIFNPKSLTVEAFISPIDFNPNAQILNIVAALELYNDENKKYVYSIISVATSTTLPAISGRSYAYSENSAAYIIITSGTITWTSGSIKRHIIVIDVNNNIVAGVSGAFVEWIFITKYCISIQCDSNPYYLKWVHCEQLTSLTYFGNSAFNYCNSTEGVITIPNTVTSLGENCFRVCSLPGELVIPDSISIVPYNCFGSCSFSTITFGCHLGNYSFASSYNITRLNCTRISPGLIYNNTFSGVNKSTCELHVPIGSYAAYRATTYWMDFTNIIDDL